MKYLGLPRGMWLLFHRSFRKEMVSVLGFCRSAAVETEKKALSKYKEIIAGLPEFEKTDRFKMNIVNCAMLAAFYLNMEKKPTLEQMTEYYEKAMMIGSMRAFCRLDYAISNAGGTTQFVRQYTLASGGPYCDCGYKKLRR